MGEVDRQRNFQPILTMGVVILLAVWFGIHSFGMSSSSSTPSSPTQPPSQIELADLVKEFEMFKKQMKCQKQTLINERKILHRKINNQVGEIRGKQTQFEKVISTINVESSNLEGKLTERLENLEDKIDSQEEGVTYIRTQFETFVTNMSAEITDVRGNITEHFNSLDTKINNQVEELKGVETQFKTDLDETKKDLHENKTEIYRKIELIKDELEDHGLKTEEQTTEITYIKGKLTEQFNSLDTKINNQVGELTSVQAQFKTDLDETKKDLHENKTDIHRKIELIKDELKDHGLKTEEQTTEITNLKGKLTEHFESLETKINNQVEELKGVETQFKIDLDETKKDLHENKTEIYRKIELIKDELKDHGLKTDEQATEFQTTTGFILEQLLPKGKQ